MDLAYAATPLVAWVAAGGLKFAVNTVLDRRPAFGRIGLGGAVSTHTTIVSSMAVLVALREGIGHPAFGVALTLAVVVVMDALDLRHRIGLIAKALKVVHPAEPVVAALRDRLGHRPPEVAAGVVLGIVVAFAADRLLGG